MPIEWTAGARRRLGRRGEGEEAIVVSVVRRPPAAAGRTAQTIFTTRKTKNEAGLFARAGHLIPTYDLI